jgi:hypothetical protein
VVTCGRGVVVVVVVWSFGFWLLWISISSRVNLFFFPTPRRVILHHKVLSSHPSPPPLSPTFSPHCVSCDQWWCVLVMCPTCDSSSLGPCSNREACRVCTESRQLCPAPSKVFEVVEEVSQIKKKEKKHTHRQNNRWSLFWRPTDSHENYSHTAQPCDK